MIDTPECVVCGRDNVNNTHIALEFGGHLDHAYLTREAAQSALWSEVLAERERAHAKHGKNSIEMEPGDSPRWLGILVEEVGEATEELIFALIMNAAVGRVGSKTTYDKNPADRRKELIQTMAVASAWVDAIDRHERLAGQGNEEASR